MSKRTMVMVGVLSVVTGFGAVLVGSQAGGSTGGVASAPNAARTQSILPPARSLQGVGGGDMANGSPAALSPELRFALAEAEAIRIGGEDRGTPTIARTGQPASTTVVSSVEQAEVAPRGFATAQPTYAPTVIISAMTPTAGVRAETAHTETGSLEAQVRASVERWFPASEEATAMRVAYCESRDEPWAAEPGGAHHGVFQVADSIWGAVPSDVDSQVRQAAVVWRAGGWGMWSCQ